MAMAKRDSFVGVGLVGDDVPLVFIRTEFNYDILAASTASGLKCEDPSKAVQSSLEETDINTIVKRFGLSGTLPQGLVAPVYQHFDGLLDFHTAMNVVAVANETFEAMPASTRSRFNNEPGAFMAFISDVSNQAEAEKLGLVFPKEVPPVVEAVKPVTIQEIREAFKLPDTPPK